MVDDPLGSVGVTQCGQSLLVVISRWTHCGYHGRLAVAAKIVLKAQKQVARKRAKSVLSVYMHGAKIATTKLQLQAIMDMCNLCIKPSVAR